MQWDVYWANRQVSLDFFSLQLPDNLHAEHFDASNLPFSDGMHAQAHAASPPSPGHFSNGWLRALLELGILNPWHQAEPGPMLLHTGVPQSTATYRAWTEGQLHTRNSRPDGQAAPGRDSHQCIWRRRLPDNAAHLPAARAVLGVAGGDTSTQGVSMVTVSMRSA